MTPTPAVTPATITPATSTAEVIVIGMGPAGEAVAGQLAEAGLDVIGIDRELVGGECPYWGCVPSKMMIRAAHLLAEARRIPGIAGTADVVADWTPVAQRIRAEATDDWDDTVAVERFEGKGGRFVRGEARIVGPGTVSVGDQRYAATRGLVIATGTRAAVPPIPGLADTPYWTNREAIAATELPGSMIVLGGGAIGAELAQVYARFGVEVTIVEALDRLLPLEEPEASELVAEVFEAEGIGVRVGVAATAVSHDGERFTVELARGEPLVAETLLVATGRRTELEGLGVAALGIDPGSRTLDVDEHQRVGDGVWAVGDITGRGAFTHVGVYQADIAAADIAGVDHEPADYAALSRVTFTDPEVGSVGMTEAASRAAGIAVRTATVQVPHTARGWLHKSGNEGVIKLVVDSSSDTLVGATAAGPNGGEVLGLLALAVHAQVPLARLATMIWAYPTFHRGIGDAVRSLVEQAS
jgi:pyruvate/2-oxoglutarate dehydrogenase complex dihydrolipoamide dehydrogenase (E3) component